MSLDDHEDNVSNERTYGQLTRNQALLLSSDRWACVDLNTRSISSNASNVTMFVQAS